MSFWDRQARREQVEPFYNFVDELWRGTFGDHADFSNALYDGDFSKSLQEAQAGKHRYALSAINFEPGARVIDIGCGWGAMLNVVREAGGNALAWGALIRSSCKSTGFGT